MPGWGGRARGGRPRLVPGEGVLFLPIEDLARWLSFEDDAIDEAFFAAHRPGRLLPADDLPDETTTAWCTARRTSSRAVVDRYGEQLSAQFLVQATEARARPVPGDLLVQHFHPRG